MKYEDFIKGYNYFMDEVDLNLDGEELYDPVCFKNDITQVYHSTFIQKWINTGRNNTCPNTRKIITGIRLIPHPQISLFRNIFLVASKEMIEKENTKELSKLKAFDKIKISIGRLTELQIQQAKTALQLFREGKKVSILPKGKTEEKYAIVLSNDQIEQLKEWGIKQATQPILEKRTDGKEEKVAPNQIANNNPVKPIKDMTEEEQVEYALLISENDELEGNMDILEMTEEEQFLLALQESLKPVQLRQPIVQAQPPVQPIVQPQPRVQQPPMPQAQPILVQPPVQPQQPVVQPRPANPPIPTTSATLQRGGFGRKK